MRGFFALKTLQFGALTITRQVFCSDQLSNEIRDAFSLQNVNMMVITKSQHELCKEETENNNSPSFSTADETGARFTLKDRASRTRVRLGRRGHGGGWETGPETVTVAPGGSAAGLDLRGQGVSTLFLLCRPTAGLLME